MSSLMPVLWKLLIVYTLKVNAEVTIASSIEIENNVEMNFIGSTIASEIINGIQEKGGKTSLLAGYKGVYSTRAADGMMA